MIEAVWIGGPYDGKTMHVDASTVAYPETPPGFLERLEEAAEGIQLAEGEHPEPLPPYHVRTCPVEQLEDGRYVILWNQPDNPKEPRHA